MRALKAQMQSFQGVLNRYIIQAFEQPFTLLQDAKGVYLPHFGVVFHLEVNLAPLRMLNMFDSRGYSAEEIRKTKETKLQRVRQLKDRLSELLLEHGDEMAAVPTDENVAIAVHLFNMPSEQTEGVPTQFVIETSRQTLVNSKSLGLTKKDFGEMGVSLEF
jgi:hypothetical protein